MIVVNYYQDEDYNKETDSYILTLAGVVNDSLDLLNDIELLTDCLENSDDFNPKNGVMYEIYLERATIKTAFPLIEYAFAIKEIIEKNYDENLGFYSPDVEL